MVRTTEQRRNPRATGSSGRGKRTGYRPRVESLEDRTLLATIRWINPAGGSWHEAGNWDLGRVPGTGDDVVIDAPGKYAVDYSASFTSVQSLTSERAVFLTGGRLTVLNEVRATGSLQIQGGWLVGGTIVAGVEVEAQGPGGRLEGVTLDGNLHVNVVGTLSLDGRWRNRGTMTLSTGTLSLGGTFTTADLGTLQRTGGDLHLAGTLDNVGSTFTLNAKTGSLRFQGGRINGGTVVAAEQTALLVEDAGALLNGVTLDAELRASRRATVTFDGVWRNRALLTVDNSTLLLGGT